MADSKYKIFKNGPLFKLGRWLFSIHSFIVFRTYLKLNVKNKENLPEEPFIICSNHQSHLDAIILGHIGAFYFSRSALIAAKDYWYDNQKRFFISRFFFNLIPINRKENAQVFNMLEATRMSKWFISHKGRCIVILPEGTRSKDGKIRSFKKGVATLSKMCHLPVVPVYIENSGQFWPKGSFFIRPGKLRAIIGKPLPPEGIDSEVIRESIIALSQVIDE